MNPPIRDESHKMGLWDGIENNIVDVIGSDHAPHTLEEKINLPKFSIRNDRCSDSFTNNVELC